MHMRSKNYHAVKQTEQSNETRFQYHNKCYKYVFAVFILFLYHIQCLANKTINSSEMILYGWC